IFFDTLPENGYELLNQLRCLPDEPENVRIDHLKKWGNKKIRKLVTSSYLLIEILDTLSQRNRFDFLNWLVTTRIEFYEKLFSKGNQVVAVTRLLPITKRLDFLLSIKNTHFIQISTASHLAQLFEQLKPNDQTRFIEHLTTNDNKASIMITLLSKP